MSTKAARGTKRVCQNCGSKFYDLSRDPIICPICHVVFQKQEGGRQKPAPAGNAVEDDDDDVVTAAPVEVISLDEAAAEEADLPDLEGDDLVVIEDDEADLKDDEAFIEVEEDDDGGDVTGIIGGPREDDEEV